MVPEPFFRVWMIYPHLDGSLPTKNHIENPGKEDEYEG
jgi:hypothetical protein